MPKHNDIDTAMIERAAYFSASIFVGSGQFRTEDFPTLEAAREAAIRFKAEVNNGRRGMVYAVTAEGRSALVPDHYQPSSKGEPAMTTETTLSSTQIAQLSAILTGGGMKRANSKEAATKRFLNVAAESGAFGHDAAIETLAMSFEAATRIVEAIKAGIDQANATPPLTDEIKAEAVPGGEPNRFRLNDAGQKAIKTGKRAATLEAAQRGELPAAPDFTAETHKRFRPKLAAVVAMAEAGDLAGLKAIEINPISSSPKAIAKYRDLAVIALEARGKEAA
ncbi:hypothetical protein [Devosia ginsengisoli]|uniref:hypothetical protein n=1 Tax=Devosia ginsengisoli TaxID=400770 RepID=UPI0026F0097A|nr:hypothetical protein [Devosia ginsengisoli]MCR6673244.1 hypothetical protein [Devosia ginsengisoli]